MSRDLQASEQSHDNQTLIISHRCCLQEIQHELGIPSDIWENIATETQLMVMYVDAFPSPQVWDKGLLYIIAKHEVSDPNGLLLAKVCINDL